MIRLSQSRSLRLCWASLGLCCLVLGCGSGDALVPVEGTVTLNGQPLAEAAVTLLPVTATSPGPFSGTTDNEGRFVLGPSSSPDQRGVAPGEYRLTISTLKVAPMEVVDDSVQPQVLAKEVVPGDYRSGNMRFEVPAGGTTSANFEIVSKR